MRTSSKTNGTPGWPNLHKTAPGREKHIKRGAKASSLSLSLSLFLLATRWGTLRVFGSTCPPASRLDFPAII